MANEVKDWTGNSKTVYSILGANNHSKEDREQHDFYATDPIAIDKLINEGVIFKSPIWECACGAGHLSKRLQEYEYEVYSTDLIYREYGLAHVDFLKYNKKWNGTILTNPPYKQALEFVEHALDIVTEGNEVWMFLKLSFLESKKRRNLFDTQPPKCVYVFSDRIYCPKNGDFNAPREHSAVAYTWMQWVKGYKGDTVVKWL